MISSIRTKLLLYVQTISVIIMLLTFKSNLEFVLLLIHSEHLKQFYFKITDIISVPH